MGNYELGSERNLHYTINQDMNYTSLSQNYSNVSEEVFSKIENVWKSKIEKNDSFLLVPTKKPNLDTASLVGLGHTRRWQRP